MDLQQDIQRQQQKEKQPANGQFQKKLSKDKKAKVGQCPQCGWENDSEAVFCENCGAALRESVCPHCGVPMDPELDYCEACGQYTAEDRCSFCSAPMTEMDTFCPECGSPREGLECPVCHMVSRFSFCPGCGTALTDSARLEQERAWDVPFKSQLQNLVEELEQLWMTAPVSSTNQRRRREKNQELRRRVLQLLEEDGVSLYNKIHESEQLMDEGELQDMVEMKRSELQQLLDRMAITEQATPAQARLYCMARKPGVSKLGWRCNYKKALHSSPLGCACPQKGGKWIVLGGKEDEVIQDDK